MSARTGARRGPESLPEGAPESASPVETALAGLTGELRDLLGVEPVDGFPTGAERAVGVVPLGLTRVAATQPGDAFVTLRLRLLVVPAGPRALADLEAVLVGLDRRPHLEVERDEPPLPLWSALAVAPRPAAVVRLAVAVPIPVPAVATVRGPLRVTTAAVSLVRGVVLGPGGVPLAGARIDAPSAGSRTRTDRDGGFRILVPRDVDPVRIVVGFKHRAFVREVPVHEAEPVVVHCDDGEET